MERQITEEQVCEIEEVLFSGCREEAYRLLKEYAGIEARPYTAWDFYDDSGNFIGEDQSCSIRDLILNAYKDIVKE